MAPRRMARSTIGQRTMPDGTGVDIGRVDLGPAQAPAPVDPGDALDGECRAAVLTRTGIPRAADRQTGRARSRARAGSPGPERAGRPRSAPATRRATPADATPSRHRPRGGGWPCRHGPRTRARHRRSARLLAGNRRRRRTAHRGPPHTSSAAVGLGWNRQPAGHGDDLVADLAIVTEGHRPGDRVNRQAQRARREAGGPERLDIRGEAGLDHRFGRRGCRSLRVGRGRRRTARRRKSPRR